MKLYTYFRAMEKAVNRINHAINTCIPDIERYVQSVRQADAFRDGLIRRMERADMAKAELSRYKNPHVVVPESEG